jgi:hypothetical protein
LNPVAPGGAVSSDIQLTMQLSKHAEKVQFLKNFVNGDVEHMPNNRPLMLRGSGGNGKSKVITEVWENSPVNIMLFYPGDGFRYLPAATPSEKCVVLIHSNGSDEEMEFAEHMNAYDVEFKKDPAFA